MALWESIWLDESHSMIARFWRGKRKKRLRSLYSMCGEREGISERERENEKE